MAASGDVNAEHRVHAAMATKAFARAYGAMFPNAVAEITDDAEGLPVLCGFPAEAWIRLRPTNSISRRSPRQLRTKVTRGTASPAVALATAVELVESAQARWRAIIGAHRSL
ncbi:hypothetical protein AB0I00_19390 [Streptomyces sp. NPDC050803]|uniref:hypothetical protein n=1 Tax=unclassified Streptomyces TaxID=2593676 RepID=UPI003417FE80